MEVIMKSRRLLKGVFILSVLVWGISSETLYAQYFGRNKVQYESFNFKIASTQHFDIYFYPEEEKAALQAARMAERWYARFARILNHELRGRQILILYSSSPKFQQTTAIPGIIGEGIGGVTEPLKRRIILPLAASLADTNHVIGHELVHAFQYDITAQSHSSYASGAPTALRIPLWFVEGMAEYLSRGPADPLTSMWMRDITERKDVPTIKHLDNTRYFPYRYGQAVWAYLTGLKGDEVLGTILKGVSKTGNYESVIETVMGEPLKKLSEGWKESMEQAYLPLVRETKSPRDISRLIIKSTEMNKLNVSPSLSPDGKNIVFLSTRDLFSVEMYLADAQTGKIKKRLTKTDVNPHFQSLEFIKSSGSWDSTGKKFAFSAIAKGQPVLTVMDMEKDTIVKEERFREMGEILNPTWSPDDRFVAFSALAGGFTDLYLYDLESGQTTKLTDDPYSDLMPAWSPDGRFIAFATERFSTDLATLEIGDFDIGLLEVKTGDIRKVPCFEGKKNLDPQWAEDGKSIYFVSDQDGINNVYRKDLSTQEIFQVTKIYTGVSGLTQASPAISSSYRSDQLAYSLYEDNGYNLYVIDSMSDMAGSSSIAEFPGESPAILPPRRSDSGEVAALQQNSLFGLPSETSFPERPYKPKLSLDYIAPPQVAVGVDRFGTYAGGGVAFFFSDILGYENLTTMVQVSSRLKDTAALAAYQFSKHRWNWAVAAQRYPYVTGAFAAYVGEINGEPVSIEEEYLQRQVYYQLTGITYYPFSQVKRMEFSLGYNYIDFGQELDTYIYSLIDGTLLSRDNQNLPAPDSLHFASASAALVYDSSFFGAASPILGQRYRLEVSPLAGSFFYYTVLADYRRYFMPVRPFTLAFRVLHYGRYGSGAEDSRFFPLFIGYQDLIRGYNTSSFSASECGTGACEVFDRLFGSKIVVANAEIRFPLFQVLGIGKGYYGILPIEFLTFFDVGMAWDSQNKPWFLSEGTRKPVYSAGVGMRMNLFGAVILGVDFVRPFSRPQKGWYFQFTFIPGF
jgi:Tol biopolymer transport system component